MKATIDMDNIFLKFKITLQENLKDFFKNRFFLIFFSRIHPIKNRIIFSFICIFVLYLFEAVR